MLTRSTLKPALLMGTSALALLLALGSLDAKADPPGKTATRNAVVTNDKDNGTRTRDTGVTRNTTATGPNGSSETRVTSLACDKSIGSCTLDVTSGPKSGKH